MTRETALRIQAKQTRGYAEIYGPHVYGLVARATQENALLPDTLYDLDVINRCIPRGGAIEALIPEKRSTNVER